MNQDWQNTVGNRKLQYIIDPTSTGLEFFSVSNCALFYEAFRFESWETAKLTPGDDNDCPNNGKVARPPVCENQMDCSEPTMAQNEDEISACEQQYSKEMHQKYSTSLNIF